MEKDEWAPNQETKIIFEAIESRLEEFAKKFTDGSYNRAYECAFQIGMLHDIEESLNIIKKNNTKLEIEHDKYGG